MNPEEDGRMVEVRRWLAVLLILTPLAGPASAQEEQGRPWKLDAEVGANLVFGATDQASILSRSRYELQVPNWELGLGGSYNYGETADPESGRRFVSQRAWSADISADFLPSGSFSPFLFATAEGSFQRQIDTRVSGGIGGKYRFVDRQNARVDLSIAALLERTDARSPGPDEAEITSIGRWSTRLRARRTFAGDRMTADLVTFYRPRIDDVDDNYTIELTAGIQYALTSVLGLKLSLVDTYDSLAMSRGARSNNDGRILFGVIASVD